MNWNPLNKEVKNRNAQAMNAVDANDKLSDDDIIEEMDTPEFRAALKEPYAPITHQITTPGSQPKPPQEKRPVPASMQAGIDVLRSFPEGMRPDRYRATQEGAMAVYNKQIEEMEKVYAALGEGIEKRKTIVRSIAIALKEIDGKPNKSTPRKTRTTAKIKVGRPTSPKAAPTSDNDKE